MELKNGDHLIICPRNGDSLQTDFRSCVCAEEAVERKIHPSPETRLRKRFHSLSHISLGIAVHV